MAESSKVSIGTVVLLVSTVILLAVGLMNEPIPSALAAPAALGMAVGALLVGTSVEGSPV